MARNPPRSRRTRKAPTPANGPARALRNIRTSAKRAMDAGVQAATGARESAVGTLDALIKKGAAIESRTRRAALARTGKARDAACAGAEMAKAKTVKAVTQLEKVFERRVSQAISRLGMPSAREVRALSRQVAELKASVDRLHRSRARAAAR